MKIGISACLLGRNTRYDGSSKLNNELINAVKSHEIIEICPEIMAHFDIPHSPLEIKDDKVYTKENEDVTEKLTDGCKLAFQKISECDFLILKSKSPSCGYQKIYDGSFSGKLIKGNGMFTRIALENNKKVFTEEDLDIIADLLKGNDDNL